MSRQLNASEAEALRTMVSRTSLAAVVDSLRVFSLEVAQLAPRGSDMRGYWLDQANAFKDLNEKL